MFGRYRLVQHGGSQDWAFEVMIRKNVGKRLPSWRRREWDGGQLSRGEAEGIWGEGKPEGWGQLRVFLQTYLQEVRCLRELSWLTLASALWQAWHRVNVQEIKVANTRTIFLLEWSDCKNKTFFKVFASYGVKVLLKLGKYFNKFHINDLQTIYKQM